MATKTEPTNSLKPSIFKRAALKLKKWDGAVEEYYHREPRLLAWLREEGGGDVLEKDSLPTLYTPPLRGAPPPRHIPPPWHTLPLTSHTPPPRQAPPSIPNTPPSRTTCLSKEWRRYPPCASSFKASSAPSWETASTSGEDISFSRTCLDCFTRPCTCESTLSNDPFRRRIGFHSTEAPRNLSTDAADETAHCSACMEHLPLSVFPVEKITPDCMHATDICLDCISSSITTQMESSTVDQLKCPLCPGLLTYQAIQTYASKATYTR